MKNKKLLISVIVAMAFITTNINAQAFDKGKIIVSAGYGFGLGGAVWKTYEGYLNYSFSSLGPIHGKFEYGVSEKIGLGLSINYRSYKVAWAVGTNNEYEAGWKGSSLSALARMNIHFGDSDKLDAYWGFGLGYRSNNFDYYTTYPNDPSVLTWKALVPIGFETTFGIRYYFTDNIGLYAEVGAAKSIAQAGLAVKF